MRNIFQLGLFVSALLLLESCNNDDTPEPTLSVTNLSVTIDENPDIGLSLGFIESTTNQSSVSYTLQSESVEGALFVNESTGEVNVLARTIFDFETNPVITGTVSVTAGPVEEEATITVTLTDVEEIPKVFNIWDGPSITFTKEDGTNPNVEDNQDRITENVWITRGTAGGQIYNAQSEDEANQNVSPADTDWAIGTIDQIETLTFRPFRDAVGQPQGVVGQDLIVHLITDDIYIPLKFSSWSQGTGNGGFSYTRATEGN